MSLSINREVFITCAVTGSGDTAGRSRKVPVTPEQIANDAIAAAAAGAAIVHIHVRDPVTGAPTRTPSLYREVVDRIRADSTDVVINLTAGMGGDLTFGSAEQPLPPANHGTDMAGASERLAHVADCLPEICTLDCGTMNFGEGSYIMANSTEMLKAMAVRIRDLGVRPEIEAFDTGHLWFAKHLREQGLIDDPVMVQLCMGIRWGASDDIQTLMAMVSNMPHDWTFSAFSIARNQIPYVALAPLVGGNVRVGLEDNIWLRKGELASNRDLVEQAMKVLDGMQIRVLTAAEVRDRLKLSKH